MRAKRPLGALGLLLAIGLLPPSAVLATHVPKVSDVVAVATDPTTWNMLCDPPTADEVVCDGGNFDNIFWRAFIQPGAGDLMSESTHAQLYYDVTLSQPPGLNTFSRQWMVAMHHVPCLNDRMLIPFVDMVGDLTKPQTVTPLTISGECILTGGMIFHAGTLANDSYEYWINASVIPPSTPSPSPTASPTATPKPIASPTATPGPTATLGPTASPTMTPIPEASASESASASAGESSPASEAASATEAPGDTPEQSVEGATFSPEPTTPEQAPGQGIGGWPGSVPAAGDVSTKAADLGVSALAALLLLAVMGFIGELFNNTAETNYDRILAWWKESWLGRIGRSVGGLFGGGSA
jgi:hypothetical protein